MTANPYLPLRTVIEDITFENDAKDLKTFRLVFCDKKQRQAFNHNCGQFAMVSVQGAGECPIGIASSPLESSFIEFTVKRYPDGIVSSALHGLEKGAEVGIRGPFGNCFPLEAMHGKNVTVIGGGFAFTTLRATINYMLDAGNRGKFKDITVIYGARNPGELLYKKELKSWGERKDIKLVLTVDKADAGWKGMEGFVPAVVKETATNPENASVIVCGPPIMLKFTMPVLLEAGFGENDIFTSLERRMSCGLGKCGKCNVCSKYVCKDGPVFSAAEVRGFLETVF